MHNIKDHWSLSRGMKNLLLFCVALMNVFILLGQEIDNHKEFGVMGGVATYTGDLNTGLNANLNRFKEVIRTQDSEEVAHHSSDQDREVCPTVFHKKQLMSF